METHKHYRYYYSYGVKNKKNKYPYLISFVHKNILSHIMKDILESKPVYEIFISYFIVETLHLHLFFV